MLNLFELNKNLKILKQGIEFTLNKYLKKYCWNYQLLM